MQKLEKSTESKALLLMLNVLSQHFGQMLIRFLVRVLTRVWGKGKNNKYSVQYYPAQRKNIKDYKKHWKTFQKYVLKSRWKLLKALMCFGGVLGEVLGVFESIFVVFCRDLGGKSRGKPEGKRRINNMCFIYSIRTMFSRSLGLFSYSKKNKGKMVTLTPSFFGLSYTQNRPLKTLNLFFLKTKNRGNEN